MALNSAVTFGVFINGFFLMAAASDDRMMVEGWRAFDSWPPSAASHPTSDPGDIS